MLTKEEFIERIVTDIRSYLPEEFSDAEITVGDIKKPNIIYTGIVIKNDKTKVSTALNADTMYEMYWDDTSIDSLLKEAARVILNAPKATIKFDINNYEEVKEHLFIRLIGRKKNEEVLKNVAHKDVMGDLAMVYYILVDNREGSVMSTAVTNKLLEEYGVDMETLHEDAMKYAPKNFPEVVATFGNMIFVTNQATANGAAAILYPGVAKKVSEEYFGGKGYYILPSSVHELIMLGDDGDPDHFKELVMNVNSNLDIVPEEDYLSDNIYHYDAETDELEMAC